MTSDAGSDVVGHFRAGFEAVKRHPILVLPPLAVHVLLVALLFFVWGGTMGMGALMGGALGGGHGAMAGGVAGFVAGGLLFALATMLVSLVASGVVVVMARDALAGREPAVGDAVGAVVGRIADVAIASTLVTLLVGLGMLFLVIPGLVVGFLLIFTLPAVLLDGAGAVDGLKKSFEVVKANVGPVLGFVVGVILVAVGAAIVGSIVRVVPLLGTLAAAAINGAVLSYVTVVGVRLYQALPSR